MGWCIICRNTKLQEKTSCKFFACIKFVQYIESVFSVHTWVWQFGNHSNRSKIFGFPWNAGQITHLSVQSAGKHAC